MSAEHECPLCHEEIEYHPEDFHKQVLCRSCDGIFGFKLYPTGPVIEARLRAEVLERQQQRQRQRAAHAMREAKAVMSAPKLSDEQLKRRDEHLFTSGLLAECPRCGVKPDFSLIDRRAQKHKRAMHGPAELDGFVVADGVGEVAEPSRLDEEKLLKLRRRHLRDCTDVRVQRQHYKETLHALNAEQKRAQKAAEDDEVMNAAAWTRLGGTAETAWLLTDTQLTKQCEKHGVAVSSDDAAGANREQQLAALAAKLREGQEGMAQLTDESAPANLHALSLGELRGVCAAHGITPPAGAGVDELISLLEGRSEALARLEGGGLEVAPMQICHDEGSEGKSECAGSEDGDADYVEEEDEGVSDEDGGDDGGNAGDDQGLDVGEGPGETKAKAEKAKAGKAKAKVAESNSAVPPAEPEDGKSTYKDWLKAEAAKAKADEAAKAARG